ncbi:MAG: GyrI-like domain-containing protein [Leptospiraceae bacterium]|nr:GyrI-like domain-containing protein [Leptospiraceae bacterium]
MKNLFSSLLVCLSALALGCSPNVDLSKYESLREPKISEKKSLRVLTTQLEGTAGDIAGKGIGDLYKAGYKLESKDRVETEAPRGRWKFQDGQDMAKVDSSTKMIGIFALVVREGLAELPESIKKDFPQIKLEIWQYGTVAEILHIGGYDKETPTIKKLHEFIEKSGHKISGMHEEEYVKGPGWIFKGNPDGYYTIIRYQVEKK